MLAEIGLTKEYMKNHFLDEFGFHNPLVFRDSIKVNKMRMKNSEIKIERHMRKVEDSIFKFENAGDAIEGKLISREAGAKRPQRPA